MFMGKKNINVNRTKKQKKKKKQLNLLPLATVVPLPLVLFVNPSNILASVELGAKCKRAESIITKYCKQSINWWVIRIVNIYVYMEFMCTYKHTQIC